MKEKEKSFAKIFKKSLIFGTVAAILLYIYIVIESQQVVIRDVVPAYEKYSTKHEQSIKTSKTIWPSYIDEEKLGIMSASFWTTFMDVEDFYVGLVDMKTGDIIVDNDFPGLVVRARYVNSSSEDSSLALAYHLASEQETEFQSVMSANSDVYPIAAYLKDDIIYIEKYCLGTSKEVHSVDLSGVDVSNFCYVKEVDATGYEGRLKLANEFYYSNDGVNDITFMGLYVNNDKTEQKVVEKGMKLLKEHKKVNNNFPLDNHVYFTYYFENDGKQYGTVVAARVFDYNAAGYDDDGNEINYKDMLIKELIRNLIISFVVAYLVCLVVSAIIYFVRKNKSKEVR